MHMLSPMLPPGWKVESLPYASRDEWLALRQADLTASEAGALFGVHKYVPPRKLTFEKQYGENRPQNASMRRGKIMEPAVAEAIHIDLGWKMRRSDTYLRARAADPLVRLGATRDYHLHVTREEVMRSPLAGQAEALGWDQQDELTLAVECKSVDQYVHEEEWGAGVPRYHIVQAAQQALLADADGAVVACLIENRRKDLLLYAVPRKPVFEAELIARVREFWSRYEAGDDPYPAQGGDNAEMSTYFPEVNTDMVVDLSDDPVWEARARELRDLKATNKRNDKRIDELEALFKAALGEAPSAILPGWSISWRADKNKKRTFRCERKSPK